MTAKVLAPIAITDAMYTASSVAEPDTGRGEVAWNAATSYTIGQEVTRSTKHRVYIALAAGIDAGLPETTPLRWKDARPTNKWAAFDIYKSTAIRSSTTLTMTIRPGIITDMDFRGIEGDSMRVVCKNASSLVTYFDQTYSLSDYLTGDLMWEFYFGNPKQQESLQVIGLTANDAQVEITLTVSGITGFAAIGIFSLGSFEPFGVATDDFQAQPVDYSRFTTDQYGVVTITPGLSAKNISGTCVMDAQDAIAAVDVIYRNLGKPCAWLISDIPRYDYLNAFGLGSADIQPMGFYKTQLSLTVRGLI